MPYCHSLVITLENLSCLRFRGHSIVARLGELGAMANHVQSVGLECLALVNAAAQPGLR